jgi:hypothetical protein
LVFALSITPKRFLHNTFAKHIDSRHKEKSDSPYQLNTAGYNCDNDNQVAESSFVSIQQIFSHHLFFSFHSFKSNYNSFSSATGIYSSLRGPPVNI